MKFSHYDVSIAVRISKQMKERLSELSLKTHLSEGKIIRDAIEKYFKSLDKHGLNIFPIIARAVEEVSKKDASPPEG